MAVLKVAVTAELMATPVALLAGVVEVTVGATGGGGFPPPPPVLLEPPPEHPAMSTAHESKQDVNRNRIPALLPDSI